MHLSNLSRYSVTKEMDSGSRPAVLNLKICAFQKGVKINLVYLSHLRHNLHRQKFSSHNILFPKLLFHFP